MSSAYNVDNCHCILMNLFLANVHYQSAFASVSQVSAMTPKPFFLFYNLFASAVKLSAVQRLTL